MLHRVSKLKFINLERNYYFFFRFSTGNTKYTTDTDLDSIRKNRVFRPLNSKSTVFELDQLIDIDSVNVNYSNIIGIYHTIGYYGGVTVLSGKACGRCGHHGFRFVFLSGSEKN